MGCPLRHLTNPHYVVLLLQKRPTFDVPLLFLAVLAIALQTTAPTIYYLVDSTEYAIAADRLGIVHAPGYGLYVTLAHLFTYLPFGDVGYRVNLLSTVSLATVAAFTYAMLKNLLNQPIVALGATLTVVLSYHIWINAVAAEVYTSQLAVLAACGWALSDVYARSDKRWWPVLLVGVLFGLAVAMNPSSVFLGPGLALAFVVMRIPLHRSAAAALVAMAVFLASLVYFPLRYLAEPAYNVAGTYGADGAFNAVDLTTVSGLWWLLSGRQFDSLFFSNGYVASQHQLAEVALLFLRNFLGIGLAFAAAGWWAMRRRGWAWVAVWVALFLPYTYFFSTYGAPDRDTMFGAALWLMAVPIAFGMSWVNANRRQSVRILIALALPAVMLVYNFPIVDASDTTFMKDRAQTLVTAMPPDAIVFGNWTDTTTMRYIQLVEAQRPDLDIVNLYFFPTDDWLTYLDQLMATPSSGPVVLVSEMSFSTMQTLYTTYDLQPLPIPAEQIIEMRIQYHPRSINPR